MDNREQLRHPPLTWSACLPVCLSACLSALFSSSLQICILFSCVLSLLQLSLVSLTGTLYLSESPFPQRPFFSPDWLGEGIGVPGRVRAGLTYSRLCKL